MKDYHFDKVLYLITIPPAEGQLLLSWQACNFVSPCGRVTASSLPLWEGLGEGAENRRAPLRHTGESRYPVCENRGGIQYTKIGAVSRAA